MKIKLYVLQFLIILILFMTIGCSIKEADNSFKDQLDFFEINKIIDQVSNDFKINHTTGNIDVLLLKQFGYNKKDIDFITQTYSSIMSSININSKKISSYKIKDILNSIKNNWPIILEKLPKSYRSKIKNKIDIKQLTNKLEKNLKMSNLTDEDIEEGSNRGLSWFLVGIIIGMLIANM